MSELELYQRAQRFLKQKQFAEALAIYEDLAQAGDTQCQTYLGWVYHEGFGVEKDEQKGREWFLQAATLGAKVGEFYCGRVALSSGRYEEALSWFQKAAAQEYSPALLWLGLMYVRGLGVDTDLELGVKYLRCAANAGNFFALRTLGLLMIRGKLGTWKIPLGFLIVPYAVIAGIIVAVLDKNPERVTA